jgi:hypothetical protein
LNDVFPDKWIGRAGPIAWPPRSPDLTSLDNVLCGHLKSVVYSSKPRSLDELKVRITNSIHEISEQQLRNIFNVLEYRFEICVLNDGGYVEGKQFELCCVKTEIIKLLYGVYSVFLSCVHPKLLKLKFSQGLHGHPVLNTVPPLNAYNSSSFALFTSLSMYSQHWSTHDTTRHCESRCVL